MSLKYQAIKNYVFFQFYSLLHIIDNTHHHQRRSLILMLAFCIVLSTAHAETVTINTPKSEIGENTQLAQNLTTSTNETIKFQAKLTAQDQSSIGSHIVWRIFEGKLPLTATSKIVFESKEGQLSAILPAGDYVVNATYGRATGFKQISTLGGAVNDTLVLNAGAIKFSADVNGKPIPPSKVSFAIYTSGRENNRKLILDGIRVGSIIRLPAGDYFATSRYGEGNAVINADITIAAGKLTEAVTHHKAASVTLKLVNEIGAEALANTSWSILTPSGDVVAEFVGAYVTSTLQEGDYVVVARYEGRVYNSQFSIETGSDKDVELLAK